MLKAKTPCIKMHLFKLLFNDVNFIFAGEEFWQTIPLGGFL